MRGATKSQQAYTDLSIISIHAPRAGRDDRTKRTISINRHFNPRAPCGARQPIAGKSVLNLNFNPRAPCGARLVGGEPHLGEARQFQSTRPVRGATAGDLFEIIPRGISIHAPRAGRDCIHCWTSSGRGRFQSTRPVRGATAQVTASSSAPTNFNPRAPCGARLPPVSSSAERGAIFQSTRPVRGATWLDCPFTVRRLSFQSTRPVRGATVRRRRRRMDNEDFNPRAPCGARPLRRRSAARKRQFQSTRPVRGATIRKNRLRCRSGHFNPRAPCGARPQRHGCRGAAGKFQSTRPMRGATAKLHKIHRAIL